MTALFNYQEHDSWGNVGWLGSDAYYDFWGNIFARDLAKYFQDKIILDIGAGNGRVWEEALDKGLEVRELNLIDPNLNISSELSKNPKVVSYKATVDNIKGIHGDIALFKQSFHHVYSSLGVDLFDIIPCSIFINLSMPLNTEWPLSPALMKKYQPSVLNIENIARQASLATVNKLSFGYPVEISREKWGAMVKKRFTSILHDCDDAFINNEIEWIKQNQPDIIKFQDTLECWVFENKKTD